MLLFFRIIFAAMSQELVYPYVQQCLMKHETPNYGDFCKYEKGKSERNELFQLCMDFTFSTIHSLHLFRCAIRQCNDEVAISSRHRLTSLFYITNNHKYQQIIAADTLYLLSLNPDARKIIAIESARSMNGKVGDALDFKMEVRNKLYKSFLPSDSAPTFE